MISSLPAYYCTHIIRVSILLFVIGAILYVLSLMLWQTKAYEYIIEKEGIGKKTDNDKPEEGK